MNYNLSPRTAFLQDTKACTVHRSLVENPALERSLTVALAELVEQVSRAVTDSEHESAAAMYRIAGARDFVRIFRNLAETPQLPIAQDSVNLGQNRPH